MACLAGVVQRLCGCGSAATHTSGSVAVFRGKPLPYAGMTAMSPDDIECIEQRHLYRRAVPGASALPRQVVGAGSRCKHGWPQAIVYDPLYREKPNKSHRLGDTTRLTCPLLVSAVDKLEKSGAMERYNERLLPGGDWEGELGKVNEAHRLLRLELIGDRKEELAEVRQLLGEDAFAIAMRSGLASLRPEAKPDVKCLHAQIADELVRGSGNPIARQALRDIEDQGVQLLGSDECCDNCNVHVPLEQARWRLQRCKNNVGKRLSRTRRQSASRASSVAGDLDDDREEEFVVVGQLQGVSE